MAKILAFTNQKGGVGKTTSAVNVALSLAVSEVRTLLIDLDPQSNATTGLAEFENAFIRGTLGTTVFEKDTVTAVGGQLMIANSTQISASL